MDTVATIHRVLHQACWIGLRSEEAPCRDWGVAVLDWANQTETGKK